MTERNTYIPREPTRQQVITELLKVARIIPRPSDAPTEENELNIITGRNSKDWRKEAYSHPSRNDKCKIIASRLVTEDTDLEQSPNGVPLIKEEARDKLIDNLLEGLPIPETIADQIAEVKRLGHAKVKIPSIAQKLDANQMTAYLAYLELDDKQTIAYLQDKIRIGKSPQELLIDTIVTERRFLLEHYLGPRKR